MQIEQTRWSPDKGWVPESPGKLGAHAQLVLLFGSPTCLKQTATRTGVAHQLCRAKVSSQATHRRGSGRGTGYSRTRNGTCRVLFL